jgi:hypothetical protein
MAYLMKARIVMPAETAVATEWFCKQRLLLGKGSETIAYHKKRHEYNRKWRFYAIHAGLYYYVKKFPELVYYAEI